MSITFEFWGTSAPTAAPPHPDAIAFRAVPVVRPVSSKSGDFVLRIG